MSTWFLLVCITPESDKGLYYQHKHQCVSVSLPPSPMEVTLWVQMDALPCVTPERHKPGEPAALWQAVSKAALCP